MRKAPRLLKQFDAFSNDFVVGSIIQASEVENETVEAQKKDLLIITEKQRLVKIAKFIVKLLKRLMPRFTTEVNSVVAAVENRIQDAILTAVDSVIISSFQLQMKLIIGSSGHGPNIVVQNRDQRNFSRNMKGTPLMRASTPTYLKINHSKNDETGNKEGIGGIMINQLTTSKRTLITNCAQRSQNYYFSSN